MATRTTKTRTTAQWFSALALHDLLRLDDEHVFEIVTLDPHGTHATLRDALTGREHRAALITIAEALEQDPAAYLGRVPQTPVSLTARYARHSNRWFVQHVARLLQDVIDHGADEAYQHDFHPTKAWPTPLHVQMFETMCGDMPWDDDNYPVRCMLRQHPAHAAFVTKFGWDPLLS